jgi:hypothetical protein
MHHVTPQREIIHPNTAPVQACLMEFYGDELLEEKIHLNSKPAQALAPRGRQLSFLKGMLCSRRFGAFGAWWDK